MPAPEQRVWSGDLWDDWPRQGTPFDSFMAYLLDVSRVLRLSTRGIAQAVGMVEMTRALAALQPGDLGEDEPAPDVAPEEIEQREREAAFAQTQIDKGFPLLYGLGVVAIWGALEAMVEDLAAKWIGRHPEIRSWDHVAKVQIPLAEYDSLDPAERMTFLVRQLQRATKADTKAGVGAFEALLKAIGLGGPTDAEARKNLYEMHKVRNLIVHRAAVADRPFVEACPWLNLKVGDEVRVSAADYQRYTSAAVVYMTGIVRRIPERRAKLENPGRGTASDDDEAGNDPGATILSAGVS